MRRRVIETLFLVGAAACAAPQKPATATPARPLVVFLHGVHRDGAADTAEEHARMRLREEGFDVWAPQGRRGLCDWSSEMKDAVCWPSDERTLEIARAIVGAWRSAIDPARPIVVVGFSSGGAFTLLLALHGLLPAACGFVSMHGFPAGPVHAETDRRPPILLTAGRGASWEEPQLIAFDATMESLRWPHEKAVSDGGHTIADADLDAAIAFTRRAVATCTTR